MKPLCLPLLMMCLAGCSGSLGVASEAECVEEFAIPAGTQTGVKYAYYYCRELFADTLSEDDRNRAECMLPKVSAARNDLGLQAAAQACDG